MRRSPCLALACVPASPCSALAAARGVRPRPPTDAQLRGARPAFRRRIRPLFARVGDAARRPSLRRRTRRHERRRTRAHPCLDQGHCSANCRRSTGRAFARQPGRRRDAREPAALRDLVGGEAPRLVVGPARLHAAGRPGAVRPARARIRAAAGPPALRHARLEKLPALLEQTRANLVPARVPATHAETAVKQNPGVLSLVDELVVPNLAQLPEAERARLEQAIAHGPRPPWQRTSSGSKRSCCRMPRAISASAASCSTQKLGVRADVAAVAGGDPPPRRERGRRDAREDVRRVAHRCSPVAPARRRRPTNPTPAEQQAAIEAALELASAERPPRDGVVDLARETLRETTDFVRAKNFVTVPDEPLEIILMPEFQRGFAVAVLRLARAARQGPAHVLRGLADPGRLDRRRRSTPSCASTTRARSPT